MKILMKEHQFLCFFYFRALTVFYGFHKIQISHNQEICFMAHVVVTESADIHNHLGCFFSCEFFQFACKYAVPFIKDMVRADVLSVADQGAEITAPAAGVFFLFKQFRPAAGYFFQLLGYFMGNQAVIKCPVMRNMHIKIV